MGSTVILDLMGGVALLLWGLHMVHSGVVRAFGADLRRLLGLALKGRFRAFLAGAFVTALLQSSTATGLMVASFVTGGTLDLAPALAVMLGANVGTTLVVQVLSFNIAVVTPVLLLAGVIAFKRGARTRTRDLGRVSITQKVAPRCRVRCVPGPQCRPDIFSDVRADRAAELCHGHGHDIKSL